ncbi:MAG: FtsX-like permease family protein [Acidimicrobiia bacterium]
MRSYARAILRHRWRGALVIALLVGITGGAVLATIAAASRTESAFPRLLRRINATDETMFPREFSDFSAAAVRDVAGVRRVGVAAGFLFGERRDGRIVGRGIGLVDAIASVDGYALYEAGGARVLEGRLPRKDRVDEAIVNEAGAELLGVGVGSRYPAAVSDQGFFQLEPDATSEELAAHFTPIDVRIVGIYRGSDDVLNNENSDQGNLVFSPAFARRFRADTIFEVAGVELSRGTSVAEFEAAARKHFRGIEVQFVSRDEQEQTFSEAVQPYADALRIFALVAAAAGFLVMTQALLRLVAADGSDGSTLDALGASRAMRAGSAAARSLLAISVGAVLAVILAAVVSPVFPMGKARTAEPDPGVQLDVQVLGIGFAVLVIGFGLVTLVSAWRQARTRGIVEARLRPVWVTARMASIGAPVSAVTGTGFALQRRGRGAASPVATIFGVAVAILTVGGALTFAVNLDRLVAEPARYGWSWDALVDAYDSGAGPELISAAVRDDNLRSVTVGTRGLVSVDGRSVYAYGFRHVRGTRFPTAVTGRLPRTPDEATVGAQTLRALDRVVGETVLINGSQGPRRRIRIVGTTLLPSISLNVLHGSGEGMAFTQSGLRRLDPEAGPSFFLVDVARGQTPSALRDRYRAMDADILPAQRPGDIDSYAELRSTPVLLAGLLLLLGVGVLAHVLVTSVRARRHDLAILQAIGFTRPQVRATVGWQATTLMAVALLLGVPLGLLAGRWTWRRFASDLGIDPAPVVPGLAFLGITLGALLLANVIAAWPARVASRTRPAAELRTE